MSSPALLDHFSALDDPRLSWKVLYPLPEVLLVILCGTLAGADDFVEINDWGTQKLAFLKRLLPFKNGIPSHAPGAWHGWSPVASGIGLDVAAKAGAGTGSLRRERERDQGHTAAAGAAGTDRCPRHHRRHGMPARHPDMRDLTITADCGGSNGARVRLWKVELQKFADETGIVLHVHHYPPGTSKWNRIEHRLFCHITQNWRGRPLTDLATVVSLIGATTTRTGLTVEGALDRRTYRKGIKVSDDEMKRLHIAGDDFHPEWNYTINPRNPEP